jgi:hypothetical protein
MADLMLAHIPSIEFYISFRRLRDLSPGLEGGFGYPKLHHVDTRWIDGVLSDRQVEAAWMSARTPDQISKRIDKRLTSRSRNVVMACNNQHDSSPIQSSGPVPRTLKRARIRQKTAETSTAPSGFARRNAASAAGVSQGKRQPFGRRLTARNIGAIPSPHVTHSAVHFHETSDVAFHDKTLGNEAMKRTRKGNTK